MAVTAPIAVKSLWNNSNSIAYYEKHPLWDLIQKKQLIYFRSKVTLLDGFFLNPDVDLSLYGTRLVLPRI